MTKHMSLVLLIGVCLALVHITRVDASVNPERKMYAQSKHKKLDILTGKHGVETALQALRDDQVFDMKREVSGFVAGVVVLGVMLAVTWCVSIFAFVRLYSYRSELRTLKAAREETKPYHTMSTPLMPYNAPMMSPVTTMIGNAPPIAPPVSNHVVQHPHVPRTSPLHAHSHGHRHGHGHN